jgi:hypothetical protein
MQFLPSCEMHDLAPANEEITQMRRQPSRTGALARLTTIAAALSGLLAPAALAHEGVGLPAADPAHPVDQPALGLVYEGLQWDATGSCAGSYRLIFTSDCTHGPDPITAEAAVDAAPPLTPVPGSDVKVECDGNGTSGKRVQVMYVHATDVADQYATMKPKIGASVLRVDQIFRQSAAETQGARRVRFVHDAFCNLSILDVAVDPPDDDSFGATIRAVKALGYVGTDRKYLMFVDAARYCGIANRADDDSTGAANLTNSSGNYARVDLGNCSSGSLAAHELAHTLGAVQNSAAHATGRAHCTDDYDRMCYDDDGTRDGLIHTPSGLTLTLDIVCSDSAHESLFDCNHDDYFSTDPASGSYLDTHWNVADSDYLDSAPSSQWGFLRANDPAAASYTPLAAFNQNSTYLENTVTRVSQGVYDVTFTNLAHWGGEVGVASVSAYGSAGEHCTVTHREPVLSDAVVTVRCFDAAGNLADSQFDVSDVRPTAASRSFAYLFADQASAASYTPDLQHQFNSSSRVNTITRTATGAYSVLLPGLASPGGTVKVTAHSASGDSCNAASWAGAGADEVVDVRCFDTTGAPVDDRFTLVYADAGSIVADSAASGYLLASRPSTASYTPTPQFDSTGGSSTVTRTATGLYTVTLPGLGSLPVTADAGIVHVTAASTTGNRCQVVDWSSGLSLPASPIPLLVHVACQTPAGAAADTKFVLQYTK